MSKYLEALKALDFIEEQSCKPEHKQKGISDEVEKIREALKMAHDGKNILTDCPETATNRK